MIPVAEGIFFCDTASIEYRMYQQGSDQIILGTEVLKVKHQTLP